MVFDANLVLRDGTVALVTGETAPTSLSYVLGARCLDLGGTTRPRGQNEGVRDMVATLILPTAPTVTYQDNLYVQICESDNLTFGYNTLAIIGYLYTFTRMLPITVTTPFIAGDLGALVTGTTTNDTGTIVWMHPSTFTNGAQTFIIVQMVNGGDTFANPTEGFTTSGAGAGNMRGAGFVEAKPYLSGSNSFFRTISPTKKYLQATLTVAGASNWGSVVLQLSPYPFRKL